MIFATILLQLPIVDLYHADSRIRSTIKSEADHLVGVVGKDTCGIYHSLCTALGVYVHLLNTAALDDR